MKMLLILVLALVSALFIPVGLLAQQGSEINNAIEIVPGQVLNDIGDSNLRPNVVYKVSLTTSQDIVITVSPGPTAGYYFISLLGPDSRSISQRQYSRLADSNAVSGTFTLAYSVPASGTYFIWVHFPNASGARFALEVQVSAGGPPGQPPQISQCIRGPVLRIKYLVHTSPVLPSEVLLDNVLLCATCSFKVPTRADVIQKLEVAHAGLTNVEACFDTRGNLATIELFR